MIILWDFNGTILDDVEVCIRIENEMLKNHGYAPFDKEKYLEIFQFPVMNYYASLGVDFNHYSYDEICVDFYKGYDEHFPECTLTPGFEEKIQELSKKGYHHVIVSASSQEALERQCASLGITKYFDELIGLKDGYAHSKVDRAQEWMRQQSKDESYWMIGDSEHDKEVADTLGVPCVLVATGHASKRRLKATGAKVIDTLFDLEI